MTTPLQKIEIHQESNAKEFIYRNMEVVVVILISFYILSIYLFREFYKKRAELQIN